MEYTIKNDEARAKLNKWFKGNENEDVDLIWLWQEVGFIIAILNSQGKLYVVRMFTLSTTWHMSVDKEIDPKSINV